MNNKRHVKKNSFIFSVSYGKEINRGRVCGKAG